MSSKQRRKAEQRRRSKHDEFAGLKRKLQQSSLGVKQVVVAPSGEVKMSDVLGDFVAPYYSMAKTANAYRMLLTLGSLAWNASFLSHDQQEEMIDQVLASGLPTATDQEATELRALVHELIARRKALFSEHKRLIVSFDLKDTGEGYHLAVASTLEEVPLKDRGSVEEC
jgi:hypothetical protein